MLISRVVIEKTKTDQAIGNLLLLPEALKPRYFSSDERWYRRRRIRKTNFEKFRNKHNLGYFLFCKSGTFNFDLIDSGVVEISFYLNKNVDSDLMIDYLKAFTEIGMAYGYVCMEEEYLHCNRIKRQFGQSSVETQVGNNMDNFIPGIYWLTYVSEEVASRFNIDLKSLEKNSAHISRPGLGYLYQFYDSPDIWRDHRRELDFLSEDDSGIFSHRQILEEQSKTNSIDEFLKVTRKYK